VAKQSKKRRSKKQKEVIQTLLFFFFTIATIVGLIAYLWVYSEVDETLYGIEVQYTTLHELQNDIEEMKSSIEYLQRADIIAKKAREELNMVPATPESLIVYTPIPQEDSL